jgi:hypothetical protein
LQIDTLQTFSQFLLQRLQADVMFIQRFMYGRCCLTVGVVAVMLLQRFLLRIESGISSRTFFSMTRNNATVQPFSVFLNTFITGQFVFIHDLFADKLPNFLPCLSNYTNITLFMVKMPLTLIRV